MSLHPLGGLQPYVRDRVSYVLRVADFYGGRYSVTSGFRSKSQQQALIDQGKTGTQPGCSQHQYGLAVDVKFSNNAWQEWYLSGARWTGLITVAGDPVHVQAFPGNQFAAYVKQLGLCLPDRFIASSLKDLCFRDGGSWSCNHLSGCGCRFG